MKKTADLSAFTDVVDPAAGSILGLGVGDVKTLRKPFNHESGACAVTAAAACIDRDDAVRVVNMRCVSRFASGDQWGEAKIVVDTTICHDQFMGVACSVVTLELVATPQGRKQSGKGGCGGNGFGNGDVTDNLAVS